MKRYFEFTDDESSKFWEIEQEGATVTVRFGKIGTQGQTKPKTFDSDAAADKEAQKLIGEKTRKGYAEMAGPGGAPAAPTASAATTAPAAEKPKPAAAEKPKPPPPPPAPPPSGDSIYLESFEDGASKFWEIWKHGTSFTIRYGKIGTQGQSKTKDAGSEAAAEAEVDTQFREKVTKGYVEVAFRESAAAVEAAATPPAPVVPAKLTAPTSTMTAAGATLGGGPTRAGEYDAKAPALKGVRWISASRGDALRATSSSPVFAEGLVIVGGQNGSLNAFDAASGDLRWSVELTSRIELFTRRNDIRSTPTVADGLVFVGNGNGRVYALDVRNGLERWRYRAEKAVDSSPLVAGGTCYFTSADLVVHAVDAATGQELWQASVGEPKQDSRGEISSVAMGANGLFVTALGKVVALDAKSGAITRTMSAPKVALSGTPVVADGTVFVGGDSLVALDATTGSVRWKADGRTAPPALANGFVLAKVRGSLAAFDVKSGERRWIYKRHEDGLPNSGTPVIASDTVTTTFGDHSLVTLDLRTGSEKAVLTPSSGVRFAATGSPAPGDGCVYVCAQKDGPRLVAVA